MVPAMAARPRQLHGLLCRLSECGQCRRFICSLVGPARSARSSQRPRHAPRWHSTYKAQAERAGQGGARAIHRDLTGQTGIREQTAGVVGVTAESRRQAEEDETARRCADAAWGGRLAHLECRAAAGVTESAAAPPAAAPEPAAAPAPASANGAGGGRGAALTFQEAVARLQQYWAAQGCAVWVPHNSEARAQPAALVRTRSREGRLQPATPPFVTCVPIKRAQRRVSLACRAGRSLWLTAMCCACARVA